MKKLFILAAAIVAFASCSKEPETIVNDGSIKFATAQTRAAITTIDNLGDFTVYGYTKYAKSLNIFDAVTVSDADADNVWETQGITKYWAQDSVYNFFAVYAPTNANDKITNKSVNVADNEMTINFTNEKGEVDLVTAASANVNSLFNVNVNTTPLAFKHALARVAFQFQWACNADDMTIEVSDVKLLGSNKTGVLTVAANGDQIWTASEPVVIEYTEPTTLSKSAPLLPTINATTGAGYQYIIPTSGLAPQIAFVAIVKDAQGQIVKTFDYSAGTALPTQTYSAGSSYHFTMNINPNFSAIEFTVTVEEWGDVDGGTIDFGNDK